MRKAYLILFLVLSGLLTQAQVQFIGHRGASFLAPENTLASAKLAWDGGADAVEVDIHLSKDNKVMVIHDGDTKRISGQYLKVSETDSDVLRKLDVGSYKGEKYRGEKIPLLGEILKIIPPDKKLVIEMKSHKELIPYMKEVISESGKLDQLIFICFDWETILEVQKAYPNNECYWLCNDKNKLLSQISSVAKYGLKGVDLKNTLIDKETMKLADKYHLDVVAYTVDDPRETKRLIALRVKRITTNRPAWLEQQVY